MSYETDKPDKPKLRSAAWRISLWAALAFAVGALVVFFVLNRFVADDLQHRSDAWLSGEVATLADVAERTPRDRLYPRVISEMAELATREVPVHPTRGKPEAPPVFFLQMAPDGSPVLWVGAGTGDNFMKAIRQTHITPNVPVDVPVQGFHSSFRVISATNDDGTVIYLGLSNREELRVLWSLRLRFLLLWLMISLLGFLIVFYTTQSMLRSVRRITEAASRIGQSDLSSRVPSTDRNDEISQLALTLNGMLDRIEIAVDQLHTMTDALAHDLRSPLTAIRGKLEMTLLTERGAQQEESIVVAIEELDRLSEFLNASLDVAEAKADALRLSRVPLDLDELLRAMLDLYEPSMSERGLKLELRSQGRVLVSADAALVHRIVANLLDNEMKHVPASSTVWLRLNRDAGCGVLTVEDDGPGFGAEVGARMFEQGMKGKRSSGHGLGLAFVEAVVRAHGGSVGAGNRPEGGARITVRLPLAEEVRAPEPPAEAVKSEL